MLETDRISDEIEHAAHGGAWHGPALLEALRRVTAGDANARPISGAHTISEIVLHMTAWAQGVERRLRENAQPLDANADWPTPVGHDETSWNGDTAKLVEAHRRLRHTIREFPVGRLGDPIPGAHQEGTADSFYVMLHGLAQHDAYHAGQIAVLKKAIAAEQEHTGAREAATSGPAL